MIKKTLNIIFFLTTSILLFNIAWAQNLWDIETQFCKPNPNKKEINVVTEANKETEICIIFKNKSDIDTTLDIDFVDWAITPSGSKACFAGDKPKTNFGQYILSWQNKLELLANSEKTETYKIKFPTWFSGISHGCLAYNISKEDKKEWSMNVIFRKTHSIDILVWWVAISSKIKPKSISISWDQVFNWISLDIENNWNITQSIKISGIISNFFWYTQDFEIPEFVVNPKESIEISSNKISLPEYKWVFSIKLNISYLPHFNFNITNSNLTTEYNNPWTIHFSKTLILWNWLYTIGWSLILLLIIVLVFKKINRIKPHR